MKKFLSLVLALVMTMSLVTVSAGAVDFTDDSDIDYKEAVDVISALGIVDGYSDDSFRPDGSLTRGAAAKIICNLVLGPTTASALSATTAPFRDVPTTNTFAGYITYCSQQGIISGYGDGTFRPSGTLTGNAFMKMLLGALGYDSGIEGYTGANWTVNVIKQAVGIGLDDGNDDFVGSRTVTRQEAALYAFNMIKADMVQYDAKTTVNVNGATVTIAGDKAEPILQELSGYENTMEPASATDKTLQFAERYFPRLSRTFGDTDDMGRPAVEWRYRSEIIGKYADDSDLKGTWTSKVTKDDLYDLVGGGVVDDLKADDSDLTFWVNGQEIQDAADPITDAMVENFFLRNSSGAVGIKNAATGTGEAGNGVITQLYMDDDNNVTIVMANTFLLQATADYNSTRETVSVETVNINNDVALPALPTTISQEDFDVSGVKEGDYLVVTYAITADSLQTVDVAEVLTGTVSEYTVTDNVVIDGTKYSYNKLTGEEEKSEEFSINADASVVMDGYGYILYVDDAVSTSSFVYIEEFGSTSTLGMRALARAYFADGTSDEIEINKVDSENNKTTISDYTAVPGDLDNATNLAHERWYTFTENSNGTYNLSSIEDNRANSSRRYYEQSLNNAMGGVAKEIVSGDKVQFLSNMTNTDALGDEDTIFVLVDTDNTVRVYTGITNAPTVTLAGTVGANEAKVAWVEDRDGYAQYVFIDLNGLADNQVTIDDSVEDTLLFVLKQNAGNNKTVVDGATFYQYTVIDTDGTINTAKYIDSATALTYDRLYGNIRVNSDEYVTGGKEIGSNLADHDEDKIVLDGDDTLVQSGRTFSFSTGERFVAPSDADLNLIIDNNAQALLKDKAADYETYLHTTPGTIGGILKGYDLTGTVYALLEDDNSSVVTDLYIWISGATETAEPTPPSDDASIASITVKGETVANLDDGDSNTIALPVAGSQDSSAFKFAVKAADGAAITITKDGATTDLYPAVSTSKDPIGAGTYTVKVTSEDGSKTTTVTVEVTVANAGSVTGLRAKSTVATGAIVVNDGAKTITVDTSKTGGAITVAQLKASLEPSGGTASAFDTITVTDWTGTAAADTATVTSGTTLVYHNDGGSDLTYTITVSAS